MDRLAKYDQSTTGISYLYQPLDSRDLEFVNSLYFVYERMKIKKFIGEDPSILIEPDTISRMLDHIAFESTHKAYKNSIADQYLKKVLGLNPERAVEDIFKEYKENAIPLLKKAAEYGNIQAQFQLGVLYSKGTHVPKDYNAAVGYFHQAAYEGCPDAQNNLAFCYLAGFGVKRDLQQALSYFEKAAPSDDLAATNYSFCKDSQSFEEVCSKAIAHYEPLAKTDAESQRVLNWWLEASSAPSETK